MHRLFYKQENAMMDFENPPASPVEQFQLWFEDAKRELSVPNPNAMTLATVGADGRPEARIVLLKHFDERGAVFFTNYRSDKAKALEAHPYACLLFHWDELERQVRINGSVTKVLPDESDVYFVSRPRESRIGAWASDQSQPVASRAALDERYREAAERFGDGDVPRPEHWGGYRVALEAVEFWQGHRHRLHDRVVYTRGADNAWSVQRLCP